MLEERRSEGHKCTNITFGHEDPEVQ